MTRDGKWQGLSSQGSAASARGGLGEDPNPRQSEKLAIPEFTGEGNENELGKSARSYIRKVEAWLKCTRMAEKDRGVALYTHLAGRAWIFAEELDMDLLARPGGVNYFLDWVRVRFMEIEATKISNVMSELFRRCKRRSEQTVRDFNLEFERLLLHLRELNCELPDMVKAWLYLDKLRLSEAEEMAILSSVQNRYELKLLQQAAIVHDKVVRRPWDKGKSGRWGQRGGATKHVHVTATEPIRRGRRSAHVRLRAGFPGSGRAVPFSLLGFPRSKVQVQGGSQRPWSRPRRIETTK